MRRLIPGILFFLNKGFPEFNLKMRSPTHVAYQNGCYKDSSSQIGHLFGYEHRCQNGPFIFRFQIGNFSAGDYCVTWNRCGIAKIGYLRWTILAIFDTRSLGTKIARLKGSA